MIAHSLTPEVVLLFSLHAEATKFITAMKLNLKKNCYGHVGLSSSTKHMAIKDGWTRWPSTLSEIQWAHSQLQSLTPLLTREARWVSEISS